jgi:crotonobetainyl-CoA:carnitine CoA-transferase CaiB-like acyl-CoA transferase
LGEAELREAQRDVIILRMPAFGLDGPWRDRGGFAMTVEQNSGLAWLTGFTAGGPLVPRGVCDVLGGLHAIVALLAALQHRHDTGEGLLIEVPLAEAALNIAAEQTIEWTANDVLLSRSGNRSSTAAPQGVYACRDTETRDQYVVISVESPAHWEGLKAAMGHPAWADDERFATHAGRQAAHDEIDDGVSGWLREWYTDAAVEHLAAHGVPSAPTIDARRLNNLPQITARGWLQRITHPVAGALDYPGMPMTYSALPRPVFRRSAPTLGQDNDAVLTELGLTPEEIQQLEKDRIIGTRPAWL